MTSVPTVSLDNDVARFAQNLHRCVDMIVNRYASLADAPAHPGVAPATVRAWFDEPLPSTPMPIEQLLGDINDTIIAHPVMNIGTKMFAYVMSGGTQASVMADMLAAALNQNVAKWHLSPAMTEIERRVIQWTAAFIGLDAHHAGALVTSGSSANLTGLSVARNIFAETLEVRRKGLYGQTPLMLYASDQTHTSLLKSVEFLGLGSNNLRLLPTDANYTLDLSALITAIDEDCAAGKKPFCLIGNAGTVNTGAIDPLDKLADIAAERALWFHVDGAYGGLAAALPSRRASYRGIERADSIALDYHKWLYQPYEVGCTLVKDWDKLRRTFYQSAEYLEFGMDEERFDVSRHHFDLSRNAKAFKVWMSFKAYGADKISAMIEKDIALADYFASLIDQDDRFECVSRDRLGIVCFRWLACDESDIQRVDKLNAQLIANLESDGRVFVTGTVLRGRQVLRVCVINHRIQQSDMDYLYEVLSELADSIAR